MLTPIIILPKSPAFLMIILEQWASTAARVVAALFIRESPSTAGVHDGQVRHFFKGLAEDLPAAFAGSRFQPVMTTGS